MVPRSTWGRKASCWALLKRWISSMKERRSRARWRRSPVRPRRSRLAQLLHAREHGGERCEKRRPARSASSRASVVLPDPGGPHRMERRSSRPGRSTTGASGRPAPAGVAAPRTPRACGVACDRRAAHRDPDVGGEPESRGKSSTPRVYPLLEPGGGDYARPRDGALEVDRRRAEVRAV